MSSSLMDLIHQAGFNGSAANTMYAIVMAESKGNANALNDNAGTGDLSYGLAQINMLGSMGPERLQQFGLKSNADLYDPLTNLKVAYALSNHGTDFSPWSTYNRGDYKQYLGQSDATVTSTGGTGGYAGTTNPTEADYDNALGSLVGLLQAVPELHDKLSQAVAAGWDIPKFLQAIHGTDWYRTHNEATKSLIALRYSDPSEYQSKVAAANAAVQDMASQLGVTLRPEDIGSLTSAFLYNSWDQATLQKNIGAYFGGTAGVTGGQGAQYSDQLKQWYSDYGVPMPSDAVLNSQIRAVLDRSTTIDAYKEQAIRAAKSMYPSIAGQLDAGLTVKDVASPYIQQMGNILEIDPNNIGVNDPLVKKALQGAVVTANGKATATSTPLWQFEQTLRADPRWANTQNARDTVSSALVKLGGDFGFAV